MKFLHAADVHLDSPPSGAARGGVPRHVRHDATRGAFKALVSLALAERVDLVLIAGDLYDNDQRDFGTALFFAREMGRLAPIPCVMIRGNHDAAAVITRHLQPPPNVRILSERQVETVLPDGLDVAIHGRSFPKRAVPEDLAATYPAPVPGRFNIGLLHTSLEGAAEHETYAPCTVETLVARGYDYWALGHIHQRRIVRSAPPIVFPGNVQGRNPRETGAKGCMVVTVEGQSVTSLAFHPLDVMRWGAAIVDLGGAETMADLSARLHEALSSVAAGAEGRPSIVRVTLSGATPLHRALADAALVEAECRSAAASVGDDVHVERVRVATRPMDGAERSDPLAPLFLGAFADEELVARLLEEAGRLRAALPVIAASELPRDRKALAALLEEAWALAGAAFEPV